MGTYAVDGNSPEAEEPTGVEVRCYALGMVHVTPRSTARVVVSCL